MKIKYVVDGVDEYKYALSSAPVLVRLFSSEWERDRQIALDNIEKEINNEQKIWKKDYNEALLKL